MSEIEHSPLPWEYDKRDRSIWNSSNFLMDLMLHKDADAELIVRAVNSHYDLVEALEVLLKWAIEAQEQIDPDWSGEYFEDSYFGRAAAAIAKARGE